MIVYSPMDERDIGCVIAVELKSGGYYQGKLTTFDTKTKQITLANVFKEGVPLGKCMTIESDDIVQLKLLMPPATNSVCEEALEKKKKKEMIRTPTKKSKEDYIFAKLKVNKNVENGCVKSPIGMKIEELVDTKPARIAETPMFRKFERQVPHPTMLSEIESSSTGRGHQRNLGPSGIPFLDALNCYHSKGSKNQHLRVTDFDLDSDFDFAENLKLFSKAEEDDEYFEKVEKLKVSKNFQHYENIVDDEKRVISWTNMKARKKTEEPQSPESMNTSAIDQMMFWNPCYYESTDDDHQIPAISVKDKREFLQKCSENFGASTLDMIIGDRLMTWIIDVQERFGIKKKSCVVVASSRTSVMLVRRILTHLDKRGFDCSLFGKFPGHEYDNVKVVSSTNELPSAAIVCILCEDINDDVEKWLRRQNKSHFVCVENVPKCANSARMHLLMLGCATAQIRMVEREMNKNKMTNGDGPNYVIAIDSAVADIGSPSNWFEDREGIAAAFATSFITHLI